MQEKIFRSKKKLFQLQNKIQITNKTNLIEKNIYSDHKINDLENKQNIDSNCKRNDTNRKNYLTCKEIIQIAKID